MADQRNSLRTTFDTAVWLYDEVRPGYPENLFDGVVTLSGIQPAGRILEIGFGTGQATVPFARRGYHILCIELGENLAAVAPPQPGAISTIRSTHWSLRGVAFAKRSLPLARP